MGFRYATGRLYKPKGGGYTTWWDLDGLLTNCYGAYRAKGAESYAASKVNLANPGVHDLTEPANYPSWSSANGWDYGDTYTDPITYLNIGAPDSFTPSWIAILCYPDYVPLAGAFAKYNADSLVFRLSNTGPNKWLPYAISPFYVNGVETTTCVDKTWMTVMGGCAASNRYTIGYSYNTYKVRQWRRYIGAVVAFSSGSNAGSYIAELSAAMNAL